MKKRQASSLVLITLTLTMVMLILLAGSSGALSLLRQRTTIQSAQFAETQARAAYTEGVSRVTSGQGLSAVGEFGVQETSGFPFVISPKIRGMQPATSCGRYVTGDTPGAFDPQCARYGVAVRTVVRLNAGETYTYRAADLPSGVWVDIPIPNGNTVTFTTLGIPAIPVGLNFEYQYCSTYSGSCSGTIQTGVPGSSGSAVRIRIRATYGAAAPAQDLLRVSALSGGAFAIGKGFTTIESVGYAPDGSEYRLLTILRNNSRAVVPISSVFDSRGFCYPEPNACR